MGPLPAVYVYVSILACESVASLGQHYYWFQLEVVGVARHLLERKHLHAHNNTRNTSVPPPAPI